MTSKAEVALCLYIYTFLTLYNLLLFNSHNLLPAPAKAKKPSTGAGKNNSRS